MSDDYLWDTRGQADPEVRRLEEALGRFRQPAPELKLSDKEFEKLRDRGRIIWMRWTWPRLAFAAGALAMLVLALIFWQVRIRQHDETSWAVARLDGTPRVGATPVTQSAHLRVGQWLETDADSRARIRVSNIGEVVVEPNSRLRLAEAQTTRKQLSLEYGALTARITAPPWLFYVDTPSATVVDLGCEYTLEADEKGNGRLRVTLGWVQLYDGLREAMIPAGAAAKMRHGSGPGTPYYEDTTSEFQDALEIVDFGSKERAVRQPALSLILAQARKQDVLSLFPLLVHVPPEERGLVFDRLSVLVPPPPGVTREGVLGFDERQINLWWNEWGIGHPKK